MQTNREKPEEITQATIFSSAVCLWQRFSIYRIVINRSLQHNRRSLDAQSCYQAQRLGFRLHDMHSGQYAGRFRVIPVGSRSHYTAMKCIWMQRRGCFFARSTSLAFIFKMESYTFCTVLTYIAVADNNKNREITAFRCSTPNKKNGAIKSRNVSFGHFLFGAGQQNQRSKQTEANPNARHLHSLNIAQCELPKLPPLIFLRWCAKTETEQRL